MLLPAIACSLLMGTGSNLSTVMAGGFLLGFAAGAESDVIAFLAARYFGMAHYGRIYGMLYMPFGIGSGVSPILYGVVRDRTGSYDAMLSAAIVMFAVGGVLLLTLGRYPTGEQRGHRLSDPRSGLDAVAAAVGADALVTDQAERDYVGQDIFSLGRRPAGIFRPRDIDSLSRGIAAAAGAGIAIVPRGGGMSYTSGLLPAEAGALVVDVSAMDRILAVNETDMTVTVEAGCTWAKLYEKLHPMGLRPPVWGTLSGMIATVGGGMSQNGVFWGAGRGPIVSGALSFDVVLADGRVVRTGNPGMRPFGPDLTGLFAADCGAFGIKAHVTLPLIREAKAFAYGSYAFDDAEAFIGATSEIARAGLATECFGFDPFLQAQRMKRDSLSEDAKALVGVMKSQGGFWKGLKEGAKIVAAGRSFLDEAGFSVHTIGEGRNQPSADADLKAINAIVKAAGGRPVENTIPKVMRANPFPNVNSMVGPQGERWVPMHGVLRHSKALPALNAIVALYERHRAEMERFDVGAGYLFLTVGTHQLPDRAGVLLARPARAGARALGRAGTSREADALPAQSGGARADRPAARRAAGDLRRDGGRAFPDRSLLSAEDAHRSRRVGHSGGGENAPSIRTTA